LAWKRKGGERKFESLWWEKLKRAEKMTAWGGGRIEGGKLTKGGGGGIGQNTHQPKGKMKGGRGWLEPARAKMAASGSGKGKRRGIAIERRYLSVHFSRLVPPAGERGADCEK